MYDNQIKSLGTGTVNVSTNSVTLSVSKLYNNGNRVFYTSTGSIGGLTANKSYFTTKSPASSSTVLLFCSTISTYISITAIDLTSTSGTHTFYDSGLLEKVDSTSFKTVDYSVYERNVRVNGVLTTSNWFIKY